MADLFATGVLSFGVVLIAVATWLGYQITRLTTRAPFGWILLDIAFGVAFLRAVDRLYDAQAAGGSLTVNDLLSLPIYILVFTGVYYMYRDFRQQLKERQAEILAPKQSGAGQTAG